MSQIGAISSGFGIIGAGHNVFFRLKDGSSLNLEDKSAELVMLLAENQPKSGVRIAEALGVTESHVIKLSKRLIDDGIIKKERSDVARNVMQYSLAIPVFDRAEIDKLKEQFNEDLKGFVNEIGSEERALVVFLLEAKQVLSRFSENRRRKILQNLVELLADNK